MPLPTQQLAVSKPNSLKEFFVHKPQWVLTLVVLIILGAFITKPLNFDDPLFTWAARQIQLHPADPYGFNVNWYDSAAQMWKVTDNPPLACYYLAAGAAILGWSEIALHAFYLLPALAAMLGTYRLARRFCSRPMLAAAITFFTPAFLVSSTTLMCDVLMLAFWVWALIFWIEGIEHKDQRRLAAAAFFMTFAIFTKYSGLCLLPLAAAWSLLGRQRARDLIWLLLPVVMVAVYERVTGALYEQGLLTVACEASSRYRNAIHCQPSESLLLTLAFSGGCLAPIFFFTPFLWTPRKLMFGTVTVVVIVANLYYGTPLVGNIALRTGASATSLVIQFVIFSAGGVALLLLSMADILKRRDAGAFRLGFWLWGTFVFTAFFNWCVNARSVLPMSIPLGILIARRLEANTAKGMEPGKASFVIPLVLSATLALWVAMADFILAKAVRTSAEQVLVKCQGSKGVLWFGGHWGFQYYMQALGARPVDRNTTLVKAGDDYAIPCNNANLADFISLDGATRLETVSVHNPCWLATHNQSVGAGFYSSIFGPVPSEEVDIFVINRGAKDTRPASP